MGTDQDVRFTDVAYVPRPYDGRITLFKAADSTYDDYRDPWNGWRRLALGGIDVHNVPGDHRVQLNDPYVEEVAVRLTPCLEAAQRRTSRRPASVSLSLAGDLATALAALIGG
jgi:thioesterase domain-containing protein